MDPLELREAPSMEGNGEKLKEFFAQLVMLWWAGVREACCLHRVLFFCKRSYLLFITRILSFFVSVSVV
jgi:hypothetical protein